MLSNKIDQKNSKFTFADLFAGIGGMRLAFENLGGSCQLTSEIDDSALETYKLNFKEPKNHIFISDVHQIKLKSLKNQNIDILLAGFPCQPYSIAGLRKGLKDDRGGQIFKSLLRILSEIKPSVFLLENVKGIASHDNGKTFKYMLEQLSNSGYHLKYESLNTATHSNIPQNRERIFIVGFKRKKDADKFKFPAKINLTKELKDCLETGKVDDKYYYDERYAATKIIREHVIKRDVVYQWRRHYVRENKSNLCPTLTANMGTGGHNVPIILDKYGIRKLTPRECANFQGFPKSFKLPNIADNKLYHQFGNSVTVPLINKIAKQIMKVMN